MQQPTVTPRSMMARSRRCCSMAHHYDWDLLKHRATHLQKVFPAAEMRLVSSVGFSSSVLQPPIDKGLCTSIHSCRMAGDCLTGTRLGCITEKKTGKPYAFAFQALLAVFAHIAFASGLVHIAARRPVANRASFTTSSPSKISPTWTGMRDVHSQRPEDKAAAQGQAGPTRDA